jgi:FkbM family methyltransferase
MKARERIRRALPRSLSSRLYRIAGRAYLMRATVRSLLGRGRGQLPPGALDCTIARNRFGLYCVPSSSRERHEAQRILQGRVWEPETIELLSAADPDGDIVHAGTFFGDFLPALASSRRNGALVWGFEPNVESYRCAEVTVLLNGLANVVLTRAALAAEDGGTAQLATMNRFGKPMAGGSRVLKKPPPQAPGAGPTATEVVDLVSIDQTVGDERPVAVIQLDIEGHEQEALTGALKTIERCRPVIVLEQMPEPEWFQRHLAPLGYRRSGTVAVNSVLRAG